MDDGHLNINKQNEIIPDVEVIFRPQKIEKKFCEESSKVLGLYWKLYSKEDERNLESHLNSCLFCQKEFNQLKLKQERVKKEIPNFPLSQDLRHTLNNELSDIVKNTFSQSLSAHSVIEANLTSGWGKLLKIAPRIALGLIGVSLLTGILLIPWI